MRYSEINKFDVCNGEGIGCSLFVQGCEFRVFKNGTMFVRQNKDVYFDYQGIEKALCGKEWTEEIKNNFIELALKPEIKRISILGGEPLHSNNVKEVYELCIELKELCPDKALWIYTGYSFEQVINKDECDLYDLYRRSLLFLADIVVDGQFEKDKKDLTLAFRGSSNQRIINVQETLKQKKIILWSNK